mmetsp:Transcript_4749/g.10118  ORF Transcript_4749/g.10118 Transcript_4749/m.10118 type:complete len:606 (-) Transcript_4749:1673-3490(-)
MLIMLTQAFALASPTSLLSPADAPVPATLGVDVTRPPGSAGNVPDLASTVRSLARFGARPTLASQAGGDDICRAAFFLFDAGVEALAPMHLPDPALSMAMIAMLLGVNQMRHRHIRGLMSQPRYVGRMFRDYYGLEIPPESELIQRNSFSFQDLNAMAVKKAARVASSLLQAGAIASYRAMPGGGKTPLMHCAALDLTEIAALLLQSGADPDSINVFRQTALHVAVVHRSYGVVQLLLEFGADTTLRDQFGRSANDIVCATGWRPGMAILEAHDSAAGDMVIADVQRAPRSSAGAVRLHAARLSSLRQSSACGTNQSASNAFHKVAAPPLGGWSTVTPEEFRVAAINDCTVIHHEQLDTEVFLRDFVALRRPVLIRGGARYAPGFLSLSKQYLADVAGDVVISAATIPYPEDFGDPESRETVSTTLGVWLRRQMTQLVSSSGTPLYLFAVVEREGHQGHENFQPLRDLLSKEVPTPPLLNSSEFELGNMQFAVGAAGSGAPQHYHTHAINLLLAGQRRWWLFPPPHSSLSRQHALKYFRLVHGSASVAAEEREALECLQERGDAMYVPTDWGHATLNTMEVLSTAQEFVYTPEETDGELLARFSV